jgi:polysaccharide export outer membrane protein
MLKTPKDFVFDDPSQDTIDQYRIGINDIIQFRLFANDGYKIIDLSAGTEDNGRVFMNRANILSFTVDPGGFVRIPILDSVHVYGRTIRETEFLLQELYDTFYVDPFVQVEVINKRVIVFPGNGSDAKIINLVNDNTTLLEVIASAGGIPERGKASRIKIMRRKEDGTRKVFLIDLSTIEGLKSCDMIMQANDYVYVEPVPQISRELLAEIAPIVSILSSTIFVVSAIRYFGQ